MIAALTFLSERISALANLGLSRVHLGRLRDGYPTVAQATELLRARGRDVHITADTAAARREQTSKRWVFLLRARAGWDWACES